MTSAGVGQLGDRNGLNARRAHNPEVRGSKGIGGMSFSLKFLAPLPFRALKSDFFNWLSSKLNFCNVHFPQESFKS
jgi:hypothetical protein